LTSDLGHQIDVFNGVDIAINARYGRGGLLQGGVSTGKYVRDVCFASAMPNVSPNQLVGGNNSTAGGPAQAGFCRNSEPWSAETQFKLSGVHPLPWWGLQVGETFQNLPGIARTATFVVTNALAAPSLGRNLNTGSAVVNILPLQTQFEKRLTQLDLRVTKSVRVGRARMAGTFDVYNVFNYRSVDVVNARYGPTWLQPTVILGPRMFKFGGQVEF
jgi:hypothetical protein